MTANRLPDNPIITPATHESLGQNLNGPSVIRVPGWLDLPGRYAMYFGHHQGKFIRLAFSDEPGGPWRVHEPGVMPIETTPYQHHIASPDVHVDEERRELVMYFHGCGGPTLPAVNQPTSRATSDDGLTWAVEPAAIARPYLRLFHVRDEPFAVTAEGRLFRGADGQRYPQAFEMRPRELDVSGRHFAVVVLGEAVHIIYSRWGDAPEQLLHARLDVSGPWDEWAMVERRPLLRPEHAWEGVNEPVRISLRGAQNGSVHELRDPCLLRDECRLWLYYTVAGEQGIAVAELSGF